MNNEKSRKLVALGLITIGVVIIIIIFLIAPMLNKEKTGDTNNSNVQVNSDGSKVNTNTNITGAKTIGDINIENTSLVYANSVTTLTTNVTNKGSAKANLRISVKFVNAAGETLGETVGYVGKIATNETKSVFSEITTDVADATDIIYEIMQ
jgi:uncharacterized protein YxeA